MGNLSRANPFKLRRLLWFAGVLLFVSTSTSAQTPTQATTIPLLLPVGLAYDTQGNLLLAETGNHLIRRVSPTGIITVAAGTGTQGFAGDGGSATLALLDSPAAVAVDAADDLFLADTHNHRIRRVDATTGIITTIAAPPQISLPSALALDASGNLYYADAATHLIRRITLATGAIITVAGNGIQGFSGDGALATAASIDSPSGLAIDSAGNLFLADAHNQRIRRIDAKSGIITSVAGTGQPGFSGDGSAAAAARIDLPRGLTVDSSGNLFLVDSQNQRIRRIDAVTGQITTIAGGGAQGFRGDGGPATAASLNNPRGIVLSPASLPTLSDSANARVRQVDSAENIHTIAGLGDIGATTLTLSAASVVLYGTGAVTATLATSPASGSVTFFDVAGAATLPITLGTLPLSANAAFIPTTTLATGSHRLTATYSGDSTHSSAQSGGIALTVAPASATATPAAASVLYGLPIPASTGTLTGILPQDSAAVSAVFGTTATQVSPAAAYPITATLSGSAAGNYTLTTVPATLTITRAPAILTLPASLIAHIASTTSGSPGGTVNLLDGTTMYASATISSSGDAIFSPANLSSGTHTLTALYPGDSNFLATTSAPLAVTIGAAGTPDFSLASAGSSSVAVIAGSAATFSFLISPSNGGLASPIQLTATGLPTGAIATFSPAYIPPTGSPASFILTIQTPKSARLPAPATPWALVLLIPLALRQRRRRALAVIGYAVFAIGCGTRVNETSALATSARTYNINVLATATTTAGATLQHTTTVTLTLQ